MIHREENGNIGTPNLKPRTTRERAPLKCACLFLSHTSISICTDPISHWWDEFILYDWLDHSYRLL